MSNYRSVRIVAWVSYILLNVLYILACLQRTAIPGAVFVGLLLALGIPETHGRHMCSEGGRTRRQ